jgi:hypothetical protein
MARIINSPGVQLTEKDLSLRVSTTAGTTVVVPGFASQGPASEPLMITSTSELERVYGAPNTAAERYFYYTCREVLNSPAILTTLRLPYGEDDGTTHSTKAYSGLFYPMASSTNMAGDTEWEIGTPTYKSLSPVEYQALTDGDFVWQDPNSGLDAITTDGVGAVSAAGGFFILNYNQSTINEFAEGYYVGFADNSAFDATLSPDFDSARFLKTAVSENGLDVVPESRLDFSLSATASQADKGLDSISEQLEKVGFTGFETDSYKDHLSLAIFRVRRSTADSALLTLANAETFLGSFDVNRRSTSSTGGTLVNAYIEDSINANSSTIRMYINPVISKQFKWTGNTPTPLGAVRVQDAAKGLFPMGVYTPDTRSQELSKIIGNVPGKLDRALRTIESIETSVVDLIVDAGLSSIYGSTASLSVNDYDDERGLSYTSARDNWLSVANILVNFVENTRKDCMSIIDPLRAIFITGRDSKVADALTKSFTIDIYQPLRDSTSSIGDTNYSAMYGNWIKINDIYSGRKFWAPFSGYAAAVMSRSDAAGAFWTPPAGLNRGGFLALDLAFNPNQKQRDRLYEISVNPVVFFTGDGNVILGQKTLQSRPTAFDRINVRRLFLSLERATQNTLKYFVFEPNTVFTRSRLVNTIQPIFEFAKATDGIYDYLLVCDERNNTNDTIDQNELIVDIYLKPVKAAEFILVNFVATRTGQDFSELL